MLWFVLGAVGGIIILLLVRRPSSPAAAATPTASGPQAGDDHSVAIPIPPPVTPLPAPPQKPDLPPGMYTFGFLWRWEGGAWHLETPPTCEPITRIFGVDGAIWATSWKEIWQHTPAGWVRHDAPVRLFALHGWPAESDESPRFIAGGGRMLFHLQADRITTETGLPEAVCAVWGPTADDVFAVGWNGMVMRKANGSWAPENCGETARLTGVWGQRGTVVVVGEKGLVLTSSGDGHWTRESPPETDRTLSFAGIWGDGADAFYAITDSGQILARRAGRWTIEHDVGRQLLGIQGCVDRGEIWATGLQGNLWTSKGDGRWIDCSGARTNSLHAAHRAGERLWVGGDWFFDIAEQRPGIGPQEDTPHAP